MTGGLRRRQRHVRGWPVVAVALFAVALSAVGSSVALASGSTDDLASLRARAKTLETKLRRVAEERRDDPHFKISETPEYKAWVAIRARLTELRLEASPPPPDEVFSPSLAVGIGAASWGGSVALGALLIAIDVDDESLVAAGATVTGIGAVVGPSAGHFYTGDTLRAWGFSGLRLAIYGAGTGLTLAAADGGAPELAIISAALAGAAGLALSIWDLADAGPSAERANRALRERGPIIGPTAFALPGLTGHRVDNGTRARGVAPAFGVAAN